MIIQRGHSGENVRILQKALQDAGYGLMVDGVYGEETEFVVAGYQQKNNLRIDGIAGPETLGHLGIKQLLNRDNEPDPRPEPVKPDTAASKFVKMGELIIPAVILIAAVTLSTYLEQE